MMPLQSSTHTETNRRETWVAFFCVMLGVLLLYATTPKGGAFYWSDSPRHALNGVFVKDLVNAFPWQDPAGYAYAYYAQYPALTILFYPPLFYVLSAPFFALFGVSHETALLVVMLHYLALGWGVFRLSRFWFDARVSVALALCLMFMPEVAFWGRQVMLEVPSFAFMVWSAVWMVNHMRGGRTSALFWAVALLVLAMYTKITVAFLIPVYCAALLRQRGLAVLREGRIWWLILGAALALVPLLVLTLKFGQANVQSVSGIADSLVSRTSIQGWIWYARQFPLQMGWPLLLLSFVLGTLGFGAWALKRGPAQGDDTLAPAEALLLGCWLVVGYLFFSAIDLKEARHSVYLLLPSVLAAMLFARYLLGPRRLVLAAVLLALASAGWTLAKRPTYYVEGYAQAASYVAQHAPHKSAVLFSGYRDGAFIFNMRALADRDDLTVVRADKILLRIAVRRELGVVQKPMSDEDLLRSIDKGAIHYLVIQPKFWADLAAMQQLERVIANAAQFERVAVIPTPANFSAQETELVIYRNRNASKEAKEMRSIELPVIGRTIERPGTHP